MVNCSRLGQTLWRTISLVLIALCDTMIFGSPILDWPMEASETPGAMFEKYALSGPARKKHLERIIS
jgi:hypothetical protein